MLGLNSSYSATCSTHRSPQLCFNFWEALVAFLDSGVYGSVASWWFQAQPLTVAWWYTVGRVQFPWYCLSFPFCLVILDYFTSIYLIPEEIMKPNKTTHCWSFRVVHVKWTSYLSSEHVFTTFREGCLWECKRQHVVLTNPSPQYFRPWHLETGSVTHVSKSKWGGQSGPDPTRMVSLRRRGFWTGSFAHWELHVKMKAEMGGHLQESKGASKH